MKKRKKSRVKPLENKILKELLDRWEIRQGKEVLKYEKSEMVEKAN
jgi:hypothetical protein